MTKRLETDSVIVKRLLEVAIWISMLLFSSSIRLFLICICWRKASRSCSLNRSISSRLCWLEWAWTSATREGMEIRLKELKKQVFFKYYSQLWVRDLTLNIADVSSVRIELSTRLFGNLLFQPLDLAAQVWDDIGVLSNVVWHIYHVLLHLKDKDDKEYLRYTLDIWIIQ